MKNKKRMISIFAALVLTMVVITPSFGVNKITQPLDVAGIQKTILENSLSIKGLDNDINLATYKYNQAKEDTDTAGKNAIDTYKRMNDFYVKQAKMNLDYSQWTKTEKLESLLEQGENLYWQTLIINKEIALTEAKIERIKKSKDKMQIKVDLGHEVTSSVASIDLTLQNEQGTLNSLKQKKNGYLLDLNVLMMQDMTGKLDMIVKSIPEVTFDQIIDATIAATLLKDGDIIKLTQEIDLYNLEISLYTKYGTTEADKDAKVQVIHDADQKALDLQEAKLNLEYDLRSQYNNLLNAKDSISIAQLKIDGLSLDLEAANKRLEVGMMTADSIELLKEQIQFEQLNLEKAKLVYYLDILKLS
ncbi:MAG: TolC family protein [Vallitaleaceae bacterium]|nr:TolC family protein [Vallitaleaceae bacterium]